MPRDHKTQTGQLQSDRTGVYWRHHLVSDIDADLVAILNTFWEEASKFDLQVSWETKLIHVGNGADSPPISIKSTTINFVDSFIYLGSLISSTGYLSREVNQGYGLTAAIMQLLWKPFWR